MSMTEAGEGLFEGNVMQSLFVVTGSDLKQYENE